MRAAGLAIRKAMPSDAANLVHAITELPDHEQALHDTRLPGASIVAPYLRWLESRTSGSGAILIGEVAGCFIGFAAGWIEETDAIAETRDSNRFGYLSDISVLRAYRGKRFATLLLGAMENDLEQFGIARVRINAIAASAREL
jgi:ribosomal protein S18 acetylase RimI-like enzyme